jgi:hypothetical protein
VATPDVSVKITADATGFAKGAAVVQGSLASLQKQMVGFQAVAAKSLSFLGFGSLTIAATAAAASLIAATKSAAEYGDQLDKMNARTGIAVEDLAKFQFAAQLSDTSLESLGKALNKLSPLVVAAAEGAPASAEKFKKLGIELRNTDGSIKSASEIMLDLADVFASMPDGIQKTALAVDLFGRSGADLIPMLNEGRAGLKAMGDEAERLGLVLSKKQTAAAAEFSDNMERLAFSSKATGVAIGNALIPSLINLTNEFIKSNESADGALVSFLKWPFGLSQVQKARDAAVAVKALSAEMSALEDKISIGKGTAADSARLDAITAQIAEYQKLAPAAKESSDKRELYAKQLTVKLKELEKLRAIASGEASDDILKSDKDLNAARLKDAEKLAEALRTAYQGSVTEAKSAAEEAVKLLDKARAKRTSAADKALDKTTQGLSPEDAASVNYAQAQDLFGKGNYYAAAAASANLDKRTKEAEAYQKQADEFLTRAEAFADKAGDPQLAGDIAEAQARILEAQAAAKQQEANDLTQRAADQMKTLNEVEAKIKEMTLAAANFEIKADVTQLESDIARIKGEIEKGAVMPITTVTQNATASDVNSAGLGGFDSGGFTGWLGRSKVAGFVHGMEYVTPAGVTLQPGVIPFLDALRKYGNKVLPGYAQGGLVTGTRGTSPSAHNSSSTVNLSLDGRTYRMSASETVAAALVDAVRREALRKGGR